MTPMAALRDPFSRETPEAAQTHHLRVARKDLAALAKGRRDPLGVLAAQDRHRIPELVPLRAERMRADPFAFYRGTAAIMAADHARDPHSGILVASCGDAHINNFGFYASPERQLLFDLNDFDESAWAPWEWDVKRLVTSVIIGGQVEDRGPGLIETAGSAAVAGYVAGLRAAMDKSPLERYFSQFAARDSLERLDGGSKKALQAAVKDAEKRTGIRAVRKLTEPVGDGSWRFIEAPPVMVHVDADVRARVQDGFEQYIRSAQVDIRLLLAHYVLDDVVRRVVGVGSVGTRCYLALLRDRHGGRLILQVKEAGPSVLESFGQVRQPTFLESGIEQHGEGSRVVALQRILQAHSDPFLGHLHSQGRDFYVRQFHDRKGAIQIDTIDDAAFQRYATACGVLLARAHAQSPHAADVDRYIGKGRRITRSILEWSMAYAERSRADYDAFVAAS